MRLKVVAIRDRAADVYGQPAFVAAIGSAIRGFSDEVNGKDGMLSQHPEDFDLYHLGEYDDATGMFTQDERPKQIAIGKDLKINGKGNGHDAQK